MTKTFKDYLTEAEDRVYINDVAIDETYDDDDAFFEAYGVMHYNEDDIMDEAEYQGRKVIHARHNCDNPGPRTKARYWSCRKW